jgi:molecular chaperone GrpE
LPDDTNKNANPELADGDGATKADSGGFSVDDALNRVAAEAEASFSARKAAQAAAAGGDEGDSAELQKKLKTLEMQLEFSATRARETQERLKEEHERLLRLGAEFDNFKKRAAREKEDVKKFGSESLLKDFLPVADNLERALDHAEQHDPKQVIEGVRLVQKMLDNALAKHGVVGFSARGTPFDPNVHEALMQQESDDPPGTVVSEMARGYKMHERLIRPAAVVVAKPRSQPAAPSPVSEGGSGSEPPPGGGADGSSGTPGATGTP